MIAYIFVYLTMSMMIMINRFLRKTLILNHFFNFYFLNMDISLCICFLRLKFCMLGYKVVLEGTVSQIFYLGLRFYFMLKNG